VKPGLDPNAPLGFDHILILSLCHSPGKMFSSESLALIPKKFCADTKGTKLLLNIGITP